ncbi:hypothetical protein PQX77_002239 [Marasmius sp. AFHP31]|nr:hypothetical protein PQX77_002239 [Marasmius sp. AFHP31]
MSRFLDLEAELSSDSQDDGDEDEEALIEDDNNFIDDTIQNDSQPVPPPLLSTFNDQAPNSWIPAFSDSQTAGRVVEDGILEHESSTQQQVVQILQRNNPRFLCPSTSRAAIPASATDTYAHFSRPNRVLGAEPSLPNTLNTMPKPQDEMRKRKHLIPSLCSSSPPSLAIPDPQTTPGTSAAAPKKRKTLAEVSASAAPFGTFAVKKQPPTVKKLWSKWAAGHPVPPDSSILRRELAPGEWVEVRNGTYKGDVGMVWRPDTTESGVDGHFILLVPRLSDPKKRQSRDNVAAPESERSPLRLFNPEDFDEGVERDFDHTFRFQRKTFSHGLLIKFVRKRSLTATRVLPSDLGALFLRSEHPFLRHFPLPLPEFFVFQVGDKVTLLGDGRSGIIEEVEGETCVIHFGNDERHVQPVGNLQKDVVPGDSIQVVAGDHLGKEGLVVERHDSLLHVFARDDSRSRVTFFVHINSVKIHRLSFDPHEDVPWLNLEVVIIDEKYHDMRATVKAVRLTPLRDRLRLLLYVNELACTVEVDVDDVIEAVTGKALLEYQPLKTSQKARFGVDKLMVKMRTGRVPWMGMRVRVSGGAHKGKDGIVRDVNRSTQWSSDSGLVVSVELGVISPNMSNRVEKIDYAHVRETDSGLELAKYMPLSKGQDFYRPWASTTNVKRTTWFQVESTCSPHPEVQSSSGTPEHASQYEALDWDNPANPWNPHSLSPAAWQSPSFISSSPPPISPASPDHSPHLAPPPPRPTRSLPPVPAHWILHPALLGISIRVTITRGKWKRKTAFVTPTSSVRGTTILFRYNNDVHEIGDLGSVRHSERPKPNSEQSLMVVTAGDEHVGKFVRRIFYFYNQTRSEDSQWFIVGVVDRTGRQDRLTGELLELPPTDLDVVEESKDDRDAGNELFESVRYAAKVGKPEVRRPGEGDLSSLRTACSSALVL